MPAQAAGRERVVLVMPAFEEASSLPSLLPGIAAALPGVAIVVVDDGSRDGTADVAAGHGARVLRHPFNLGYGAALQTGYKYALRSGADYVVQMDADGQHLPSELPKLLSLVRGGECDLAVGSRFLASSDYEMGALRRLGRNVFRMLARLGGLDLTDPTSGFQAMNRAVLDLYVRDWYPTDYPDVDVLLLAHRRGLRVREVAVEMTPGWRASSLHSGWKPVYYCYKMLLSLWAVSAVPRARRSS